jgi:hypothetical protein
MRCSTTKFPYRPPTLEHPFRLWWLSVLRALATFSSQYAQAWVRYPKCGEANGFAFDAATSFVLSDDCLDVVGTAAAGVVLAAISIDSVGFKVAALEVHQAFEAHFDGFNLWHG